MAEETKTTSAESAPAAPAEVVVVAEESTTATEKEVGPQVVEKAVEEAEAAVEAAAEGEKPKEEEEKITESASFKEETNVVGELPDPQKKALDDLKQLVQEALNKNEFTAPPPPPPPAPAKEEEKKAVAAAEEPAKTEDKPAEEAAAEPKAEVEAKPEAKPEPAVTVEEPPKTEEAVEVAPPAPVETKEEETPPPPPLPEPSQPAAESKVEAVVEAIKETIIEEVTAPPPPPAGESTSAAAEEPKDTPAAAAEVEAESAAQPPPEEVSIWGIPLLADERSDVILLKFLRARDFKVKEAFAMLKSVVAWRKEFRIEPLIEEEFGTDLEKVVYILGVDKEGHPVCYNAYGEFQNKELYQNTFSDEDKRTKFLRWRIQFLEKSIRKLDFSPDGICTFVQVNDLKNSPGLFQRELRQATNLALQLLQDNYPEFVAKQVFINVPWWYLAFYRMISPFFTQRTKSKFVFAGPSKSSETLFKYIAPEQVPVQYGGLSREGEQEFSSAEPATEEIIKPATKQSIEFSVTEAALLVWELRVIGWDVTYGAEFVPSAEDGYTVIVQKSRKIGPTDEPVISGSYKIGEPGKVVLTIDNQTSKKKKLLYRSKTKLSD